MTFATCPDCHTRRIVIRSGTPHARIRSHVTQIDNKTRLCPGSGTRPTTTREA